jgi:hypothetical protein
MKIVRERDTRTTRVGARDVADARAGVVMREGAATSPTRARLK